MTKQDDNKSLRQIVRDSFDELKDDIVDMAKDIMIIKSALGGDQFGQDGIVKKQCDHEQRIKSLEKFNWKVAGFFSGVTTIIALLIKYL